MTNLWIDEYETELLREVLQTQLTSLLSEIAHADHREFRAQLQHRYDRLERLMQRIPAPVTHAPSL